MLCIIGFWATISKMSTPENTGFRIFFFWLGSFLYFDPQYLTSGNSKAYWPYHFLKKLNKIFHVHLIILPKPWLFFCCHRQQIQKMSHFQHFNDQNSESEHDGSTNDSIFLIFECYPFVYFISISQDLQNSVPWRPSFSLCSGQRWLFQAC